uniref:(California timema) hypothetical protein n=1 Tax=Timema californicum TaxID=61474 RepID=A0A7R9J4B4_TIMCA|nr:unnamed protein product [Timema californicum]
MNEASLHNTRLATTLLLVGFNTKDKGYKKQGVVYKELEQLLQNSNAYSGSGSPHAEDFGHELEQWDSNSSSSVAGRSKKDPELRLPNTAGRVRGTMLFALLFFLDLAYLQCREMNNNVPRLNQVLESVVCSRRGPWSWRDESTGARRVESLLTRSSSKASDRLYLYLNGTLALFNIVLAYHTAHNDGLPKRVLQQAIDTAGSLLQLHKGQKRQRALEGEKEENGKYAASRTLPQLCFWTFWQHEIRLCAELRHWSVRGVQIQMQLQPDLNHQSQQQRLQCMCDGYTLNCLCTSAKEHIICALKSYSILTLSVLLQDVYLSHSGSKGDANKVETNLELRKIFISDDKIQIIV